MILAHEAFIAIWLLNAKGMHLQSKGVDNACLQHYTAGSVLNEIVYVRAASKDVTISLSNVIVYAKPIPCTIVEISMRLDIH